MIFIYFFAVFNLTNGTDVENTKKLVEQNKRENQELIKKNRMKLVSVIIVIAWYTQCKLRLEI